MSIQSLGEVRDYSDLHAIFRARAEFLEVSRENIDEVAGLTAGYASKLLAAKPIKILGPMSLGAILGALGLKLVVVQDDEAMAKHANRRVKRTTHMVRSDGRHWVVTANFLRKIGAKGNEAFKRLPKWKRVAMARKAANARWGNVRPPPPTNVSTP